MGEPETELAVTEAPAQDASQPAETDKQDTPPLTIESIREAVIPEIKKELKAAYDAARRAEAKSDVIPQKFSARIERLESLLEDAVTRGMEENEARAWKATRALEREKEDKEPQSPEVLWQSFQMEAGDILADEGLKAEDINEFWNERVKAARNPSQWRDALLRSIADFRKAEVRKAREEGKTLADKAREEERKKAINEQRKEDGPIDRGQPASSGPKDWAKASDEEVASELERRKADRLRKLSQGR